MAFLILEQRKYKSLSNLLFTNQACSHCPLLPFPSERGVEGGGESPGDKLG